ncbi:hypothetical protein [Acinetobacter sp. MD2(2019)]|uniref:hypothetical protein n=1 Tax=Acinetobacter sp. MD2(2019) TaxID=2605273 RepID=UPI002D1E9B3B|nr:hypothetical protein [Acinetobacter sp. MD2(2019)]MEB3754669.1 hypothetical protein [Acinetobacter sp. MD2(2019)]
MPTITSAKSIIQEIRDNFNQQNKFIRYIQNLFLKSNPPSWMTADDPLIELYRQQSLLLNEGQIVWAAIVQANNLLFSEGNMDHPAQLVYSQTQDFDDNPEYLSEVAAQIYALKNTIPDQMELHALAEMVTNEHERGVNWHVPELLSNTPIRSTTFIMIRAHSPNRQLSSQQIPILIHPSTSMCMMVPAKFWPDEFKQHWLS